MAERHAGGHRALAQALERQQITVIRPALYL